MIVKSMLILQADKPLKLNFYLTYGSKWLFHYALKPILYLQLQKVDVHACFKNDFMYEVAISYILAQIVNPVQKINNNGKIFHFLTLETFSWQIPLL